jgi:hypothetical protein
MTAVDALKHLERQIAWAQSKPSAQLAVSIDIDAALALAHFLNQRLTRPGAVDRLLNTGEVRGPDRRTS